MKALASWCLAAYLAAQAFQQYVLVTLSAAGNDAASWQLTFDPLNRVRAFALLLSFFPLTVAFLIISAQKLRTAPRRAATACLFLVIFCVLEIAYRSIEYFVVDGLWTRELLESTDPLVHATMQSRLDLFGEIVRGVYFPLLTTHLAGSLFLLAATVPAASGDVFLRVAMSVNALRLTARLASTYGGISALSPVNDRLYFPCVLAVMASLLLYLWRSPDAFPHGLDEPDLVP